MTADSHLAILNLLYLFGVGHLVQAQLLGYLRTHLSGIAIDSLTTANHHIHMPDFLVNLLDGFGKKISSGQGVGTGTLTVGKQPTTVGSAIEALTNDLTGTRGTHRYHTHLDVVGISVLDAESLLQGVQVLGVEDGRKCGTVDRTLCSHGILTHVSRVRYLLGKYYNVQLHK